MAGRCRSIFLAITILTVVWLLIILLSLPQQEQLRDWVRSSVSYDESHKASGSRHHRWLSPEGPGYLRHFNPRKSLITSPTETLFYQLDLYAKDTSNETIDKSQHAKLTNKLGIALTPTDLYVKSHGYEQFAFNLLVSNRIGLHRPLPDTRNERCKGFIEKDDHKFKLQTSIVICYYNEAPSALLRTIQSILSRTPHELLKEIIIVDDSSEQEYHYAKVEPYINSDLVKLTRTGEREGLIRARLFGARMATGDVLVFLDSHVEANVGWLEPLINTVQKNRTDIACPMIDLINADSLIYSASPMVKGGLNWNLNFKWDSVPSEALKTYDDFVKPIESPTMAGGLYAIRRDFFLQLGEYDSGMELWGGENVELSLRTWMCGGRILILPCSRVGHIFRKKRPYGPKPDQPDSLLFNSHRTARVWLDEYIHKFYEASPDTKYLVSGDVGSRLELKRNLGCRNFSWYIDNVYPRLRDELEGSDRDMIDLAKSKPKLFNFGSKRVDRSASWTLDFQRARAENLVGRRRSHTHMGFKQDLDLLPDKIAQFQIQSIDSDLCIESKNRYLSKRFTRLVLSYCADVKLNNHGAMLISNSTILNQLWTETELHDYRLGDKQCLDLGKNLPILKSCHNMGSSQMWSHGKETRDTNIYNSAGGLCLGVERVQVGEPIIVTICDNNTHLKQDPSGALRRGRLVHLQPNQRWNLVFVDNLEV